MNSIVRWLPLVLFIKAAAIAETANIVAKQSATAGESDPKIEIVDVFTPTSDGLEYKNYRIPALVVTKQGTLLAFAEGRRVASDHNKGPIVAKRSTDGGKSWQSLQIVAEHGRNSLNNPTPVVLPDTGRILVFYQLFPEHYHSRAIPNQGVRLVAMGYDGPRVVRTFRVQSDDDGQTWSKPKDISRQMKRPAPVLFNITGPGVGIVLEKGEFRGRIVLPSSQAVISNGKRVYGSYATYSDDGGVSWTLGEPTPDARKGTGGETQIVELRDGRLMMDVRASGHRRLATSSDGGHTWTKLVLHKQLPDCGCMGCMVRYDLDDGQSLLLHSGSRRRINGRRSQGEVYASTDGGKTWPLHRIYHAGSFDYSSMAVLPGGDIGILAEFDYGVNGKFNDLRFVRYNLAWLMASLAADSVPPVFEVQELFERVRGGNIVVGTDGTVLAFAGGGRLRRSKDGGNTFGAVQQIGNDASGSAIVDEETGDVLKVDSRHGHLWRSSDQGNTWRREKIVILPNAMGHGVPGGVPSRTGSSESGVTLLFGEHKGRLLMPTRIMPPKDSNEQKWWPYHYNAAIFSDDRGKSWQTSGPVQSGTGEGTLAELSNGTIYYNSRSHLSTDHRRRIAYSYDGGDRYTDWRVSEHLFEVGQPHYYKYGHKPSYGCNAGLIRLPLESTGGRDVLVYSAPDSKGGERLRMTVFASFDRGETWPIKRVVNPGISSYSSLAAANDGTIYLLFERGKEKLYEGLSVARFNLQWIASGQDWRQFLPTRKNAE
jgi:sialidase-1